MAIFVCAGLFLTVLIAVFAVGYINFVKPARTYYRLTLASSNSGESLYDSRSESLIGQLLSMVGRLMPNSPGELALSKKELSAAGFSVRRCSFHHDRNEACGVRCVPSYGLGFEDPHDRCADITAADSRRRSSLRLHASRPGARPLAARRRESIRLALPDALDMLVVCSEVGCALDQAIQYVSREFKTVHPALSDELSLLNAELLAGATRAAALRSFATRTGEEEIKKLVAILIQTDRFGTSISESLRTQSDFMRVRRRQLAEEKAGKVGVKLVFPIFFFCMPSLVIVVAGPAMLQLLNHFVTP